MTVGESGLGSSMIEQSLSALMDGECDAAELGRLLDAFEQSPALKARWSRQMAVREALAGTRVTRVPRDFCANVMAAVSAPANDTPAEPVRQTGLKLRFAALRQPRVARRSARWRPVAGLAAAASFAAVAVVGTRAVMYSGADTVPGRTPAVATAPMAPAAPRGGLVQVSTHGGITAVAAGSDETGWAQLDAESARQLNDYLMEHNNFRAEQGMGGALSYARMAVRNAEYRPDGSR
jgi:negative regulator of sigma E activity